MSEDDQTQTARALHDLRRSIAAGVPVRVAAREAATRHGVEDRQRRSGADHLVALWADSDTAGRASAPSRTRSVATGYGGHSSARL